MKYRFLPYSRRGAGVSIVTGETDATGRPQADVTLRAELQETGGAMRSADHKQPYTVLGPGDITGIDPSQVILTSPRAGTHNMEPNYLVHIEFAHPDLPWLFTPEGPDGNRLKPWIALVVVEESPTERRVVTRPGSRNPVLEANVAELPDLNESWAWAHVQTVEADGAPEGVLENWEANRGLVLSRLLCPRHLREDRSYVACVVPTFASGVQAGLGQVPNKGRQPAWTADSGSVALPVYYHWRFKTGPAGDFETLAQKLHGVAPDKIQDVGLRTVHLDAALSRLEEPGATPSFSAQKVPVRTAIAHDAKAGRLSPIATDPLEPDRTAIGKRLKFLIDFQERSRRSGSDDLIVGPPIYGQWHAERRSVDDAIDTPDVVMSDVSAWVAELNADVELRAVAAVGTRIVQNDQEDLMVRAWEQLQAVAEANRRARWGQLYQATTRMLHVRRLSPRPLGSLLHLASPALGRLPVDATTSVAAQLQTTSLPLTVVGANFSRATRFAARTVAARPFTTQMLESAVPPMLTNSFNAASRARLSGVADRLRPSELGDLLKRAGVAGHVTASTGLTIDDHVSRLNNLPDLIRATADRIAAPPQQDPEPGLPEGPRRRFPPSIVIEVDPGVQPRRRLMDIARQVRDERQRGGIFSPRRLDIELRDLTAEPAAQQPLQLSPDMLALLNANQLSAAENQGMVIDVREPATRFSIPSVQLRELQTVLESSHVGAESASSFARYASVRSATMAQFHVDEPVSAWATAGLTSDTIRDYITATEGIEDRLTTSAQGIDALRRRPPAAVDPAVTHALVVSRLEPTVQYEKMLKWALPIAIVGPRRPRRRTPSHQIMASPQFVDPVVERLKRIDQQWVLGHAEKLPPNSISVLAANARFVEALLVGANCEMARELQWRRYPTDLMGTCFARFWPLPPEEPDDIEPIALWNRKLGEHTPDNDRHPGEDAVIVVRGDLLRRYPNTIISAVRGRVEASPDGARFLPEPGVEPVRELFRGILAPDITYAALAISLAKLNDTSGAPNFWFIALTQPADEPRFGLDDAPNTTESTPVATLNELSWQGLPPAAVAREHLHAGVIVLPKPLAGQPQRDHWSVEDGETPVKWGPTSDSGQVASILLQLPFQLLLKASDYV
jgi:hypothetical protein